MRAHAQEALQIGTGANEGCLGAAACIAIRPDAGVRSLSKDCQECLGAAGVDTSLRVGAIADGLMPEVGGDL